MRRLLVLGAGTAGTMVVNKLRRRLPTATWDITVVDQSERHYYQPGYLFLPFGGYTADGVTLLHAQIDRVVAGESLVVLTDGRRLPYDYLVIATGVEPRPDQTE